MRPSPPANGLSTRSSRSFPSGSARIGPTAKVNGCIPAYNEGSHLVPRLCLGTHCREGSAFALLPKCVMTVSTSDSPLVDGHGRVHTNLRISITDRCNIRCFYCMPEEAVRFVPRAELLTYEEIERFVRVVARLGVNKIRLTGGEPLVRNDVPRACAAARGRAGDLRSGPHHQRHLARRIGRRSSRGRSAPAEHQPRHAPGRNVSKDLTPPRARSRAGGNLRRQAGGLRAHSLERCFHPRDHGG